MVHRVSEGAESSSSNQSCRLLAHPDEEVGVTVEDEDALGVEHLLLQPVVGNFHLRELKVAHAKSHTVQAGNDSSP